MKFLALFAVPFALVCALGDPVLSAPVPKHLMKGEDPELQKLQGEWNLTAVSLGGAEIDMSRHNAGSGLEVRGDTLIVTAGQQNQRTTATFRLDTKAQPARITWQQARVTDLNGGPVKDDDAEKPCVMLYKFEAGKLVLAARSGNQEQAPRGFDNKNEPEVVLLTFTRVQK
ncbi:hypothetical protein GobsT_30510 [Gemmata obscuriglobus]|uniref:TIGR03067 domain-containing protein n=1 Tax=Gemmata obscuriglobus TaxID=114 RepID=A0A2Z3HC08_9BACT|nr:TIGR03067 domain-containing protein [Gemmata obscuriglobus]AWM38750.1 TIGR03067 domain-containing protein [Gemmata obscuriglobus]QEG28275.1 hypothetical protein GobsT_30510 [Gemmata obscuriglobus]VTS06085.1 unnamed protein product [Gemmata obscuriglobus UQM 2246]